MALEPIKYATKAATREQVGPDTANVKADDLNEIKAVTNAAVTAVNTLLEVPADYIEGFPGGTALELVLWARANPIAAPTTPARRAVLIVGQSNAQGTGGDTTTPPLSTITPSITAEYQRARIVNPATGLLEKLHFGENNLGAVLDTGTGKPVSFGVELPLADFFQKKYPSDPYAVDIAKYAKGNTPIEHWDKANSNTGTGGGGYQATVAVIDALKATHAEEGATTLWEFGYFRQGETGSANWGTKFKAFDANLIADGKIPPSFIWIVARVPGAIGLEQDQVALDLPGRFLLFDTNDAVLNSDLVHQTGRTVWVFGGTRATNRRYNTNVAAPFAMADATTATPTTLAASDVTATGMTWSWTSGGSCIYILRRSTTADFSANVVEASNGVGTTVAVGGLTADTTYYWRLTQQETGKLISAPQSVTQATSAAASVPTVPANNMLKPFGTSGAWVASANGSKYTAANGTELQITDGSGEYYNQPVNQMNRPLLPNTAYRLRAYVISSADGGVVQAIEDFGSLDSPITRTTGNNGVTDITFTTGANVAKLNLYCFGTHRVAWVHLIEA